MPMGDFTYDIVLCPQENQGASNSSKCFSRQNKSNALLIWMFGGQNCSLKFLSFWAVMGKSTTNIDTW